MAVNFRKHTRHLLRQLGLELKRGQIKATNIANKNTPFKQINKLQNQFLFKERLFSIIKQHTHQKKFKTIH